MDTDNSGLKTWGGEMESIGEKWDICNSFNKDFKNGIFYLLKMSVHE